MKTILKFLISALLVWWLVSKSDISALLDIILSADVGLLLVAIFTLQILTFFQALRWRLIIQAIGEKLTYRVAILNVLIGIFFNQLLPSSIGGDAVRVWRVYRLGLPIKRAIYSVILDRLTALLALTLMAIAGLPIIFNLLSEPPQRWAIVLLILGLLSAFAVLFVFDKIPGGFKRWRPLQAIVEISSTARKVMLSPLNGGKVLLISVSIHIGVALTVLLIATSLGLTVSMLDCLVLVPLVMLVSMVPISIAGWGLREGAMVTAFSFVGVGFEEALSLSVLFGLVIMISGIPGGIIWLLYGSRKTVSGSLSDTLNQDIHFKTIK